jgi:endo-1,4-beta-xylanase
MVHVSELDIVVNPKNDPAMIFTKKILDQQAAKYQTVATLYKQNVPARLQYGITLWDFSDADSWLVVYKNMHDIPTVHNEQYGKKVAYYGLSAGLR